MRDFHLPGRSAVFADNGMCATSHPLAAKVAINLLEQGGNAVDAAIGAAVLLGICEPQMTGIGGDCFALIKRPDSDEIVGLNASGRAPAGLSAADLRAAGYKTMPAREAAAVTIPGAVDGFCRLQGDMGTLTMAEVLAPAIHYAEAGIPVAPRVAQDWSEEAYEFKGRAREIFLKDGRPYRVGDHFRVPGQAEVLRRIAKEGRAGFYEGEVADDMVDSLRALGGTHTLEDFAATACDYVTPICTGYRGAELIELPPNGAGAMALLMANMLEGHDIAAMDPDGAERAHLEIEAAKLAFDARDRFIADAGYVRHLDHMLSPDTAKALSALIDPGKALTSIKDKTENIHKETVYITVVDRDRMVVSLIYSIFKDFGSCIASDRFGILFQNRGCGFTLEEGHPNEAMGGKRPMHTIIPAMMREADGSLTAFGVMGGAYQPIGHVRYLSNIVDFGMHPQQAIDAPRCFPVGGVVRIENGYAPEVQADLAAKGHKLDRPLRPIGGAQAIRIDAKTGVLQGASDPRKDGCALGY
ncbi:gamma-glutamyltransferase family protein [Nioella ostreopsis]|uniref:gamma-glutamyltransferase family protein n=1 Tax=Nioella ostreopsis TaxID=2448479 RepID=UPI000FD6E178|nr:gamma-glutamyltransferase family protein [Nioella ostreopsis]